MKNSDKAAIAGGAVLALYIVIIIACGYGWIHNVVTLAHADFSSWTGMLVLRCIGVVAAPLGVVMGYI